MQGWKEFFNNLPERQRHDLMLYFNEMGIRDGDALFAPLVALESYKVYFESWPKEARQMLIELLERSKETLESQAAYAASQAHKSLVEAVRESADEIAENSVASHKAKWFSISAICTLIVFGGGCYVGYIYGTSYLEKITSQYEAEFLERDLIAKASEKFVAEDIKNKNDLERAAWAITREGKRAYELAKISNGNIDSIMDCANGEMKGTIEERKGYSVCFPYHTDMISRKVTRWGIILPPK